MTLVERIQTTGIRRLGKKESGFRYQRGGGGRPRLPRVLDFLENEIWPLVPRKHRGRAVSKGERERILGYGRGGV